MCTRKGVPGTFCWGMKWEGRRDGRSVRMYMNVHVSEAFRYRSGTMNGLLLLTVPLLLPVLYFVSALPQLTSPRVTVKPTLDHSHINVH